MLPMWEFVIWFAVSLVVVFFIVSLISNPFTLSIVLAAIISFIGVKNAR